MASLVVGCSTSTRTLVVTAYDVQVRLNPSEHTLEGRALLTLRESADGSEKAIGGDAFYFDLNRSLTLRNVTVQPGNVVDWAVLPTGTDAADATGEVPQTYRVRFRGSDVPRSLTVEYDGRLFQDVSAGEKAGEIHNQLVSAHVSEEGIYLSPEGYWYPQPHQAKATPASLPLADYSLTADAIPGMQLFAGAVLDEAAGAHLGTPTWRSPYPLQGLVVVGGAYQIWTRQTDPVRIIMAVRPSSDPQEQSRIEGNVALFLDAAQQYLERYQPLLGPYPMPTFTIVENFFSSGFAFPGMTLLSPEVIAMGERGLRHGYLDHEMLHAWWGNGVQVDPEDGNWCEALASFGANLYGFVLDGNEAGARAYRRDTARALSMVDPEHNRPLSSYGLDEKCGKTIGYNKGAVVFDMLCRKLGPERFWSAIRKFHTERMGGLANWEDIRNVLEQESGTDLNRFFSEWVRSQETPVLTLQSATYRRANGIVEVDLDQGDTAFAIDLPLRIYFEDDSFEETTVSLEEQQASVRVSSSRPPVSVILDPDYRVCRKLKPAEITPTSSLTRNATRLTIIRPPGELHEGYETLIASYDENDIHKTTVTTDSLTDTDLAEESLLIVGDAVRAEPVQRLLARTDWPVQFLDSGFRVDDTDYNDPGHAVFGTVHHPDDPALGITVYYGNSEHALANAGLLGFYGNSMLIFNTPAHESDTAAPPTTVQLRRDFEPHPRFPITDSTLGGN